MAERPAVNRKVVGSMPTLGAIWLSSSMVEPAAHNRFDPGSSPGTITTNCARSLVDRTPACGAGDRRFESCRALHTSVPSSVDRASRFEREGRGFKSLGTRHHIKTGNSAVRVPAF